MPSQVLRAHGDRGAPPSFPHWCSWVLHSSLCALDVRGGPGSERPQTKTSQVTQNGVVWMGSLTFSCSCRAYPYVQFYTECTHVFWFISYCGGWTEVLWWQLGSTPWVRCRHHHHLLLPVEQAGCILLTSQGLIPFTVNPEASIHSCASQSAWLCHRFIVNAPLDQRWGPSTPAICKVLCFVSSAMHVTVTVPDILKPCTKTLQVSQRLYISAHLCISIYSYPHLSILATWEGLGVWIAVAACCRSDCSLCMWAVDWEHLTIISISCKLFLQSLVSPVPFDLLIFFWSLWSSHLVLFVDSCWFLRSSQHFATHFQQGRFCSW